MMDSPDILRRLDKLERSSVAILERLDALEARAETLGLEIGEIAKIMLHASGPAEETTYDLRPLLRTTEEELDQLIDEIFGGAESLPFDEALRRAIALRDDQAKTTTAGSDTYIPGQQH